MSCLHTKKLTIYRRQKFNGKLVDNVAVTEELAIAEWWEIYCSECKEKLQLGIKNLEV